MECSPELTVGEGQTMWRKQFKQRHSGLEFPGASVWDYKLGEMMGAGPWDHNVNLFLEASDSQVFQVRRSAHDSS